VDLDDAQARDVRFGRALDLPLPGVAAVFAPGGEFLALYEPRDGVAKAVAVFV
jgi:tRNA pseudouridine55 synthase